MAGDPNPDDLRRLEQYGVELADAVEHVLPGWVERSVERLVLAYRHEPDGNTMAAAQAAGHQAATDIGSQLRALFALDIDEQATNPLAVLRGATAYPTEVLRSAGVPPLVRDRFAEERFPDDDYDLTPATFADIDPSLHDLGLRWGAAKAFVHKARHRDA